MLPPCESTAIAVVVIWTWWEVVLGETKSYVSLVQVLVTLGWAGETLSRTGTDMICQLI